MSASGQALSDMLKAHERTVLNEWLDTQLNVRGLRSELLSRQELQDQSARFLQALRDAVASGTMDVSAASFAPVRQVLDEMSAARARQGYTPTETAMFVFSLKQPLFAATRQWHSSDPAALAELTWQTTVMLDSLGLLTMETYQKGRDQVIIRQQEEMLELSTPVITLWKGILALPLIGTLDSSRTQVVMETLLHRIVETGAPLAIIDITGVPTVDTLTAQHLLKTVAAARLMGADCIISGIRPQIAQTIVHLGVDLGDVVTKASLSDAFAVALKRVGLGVQRVKTDAQESAAAPSARALKAEEA
jgi:rsbT co-antagonist protein RsbR